MKYSPFLAEMFEGFFTQIKTKKGRRDLQASWRNAQSEFQNPCLYLCPEFQNPTRSKIMLCDFDALRGYLIKQDSVHQMNSTYQECLKKRRIPLVASTIDPMMFAAAKRGEIEISAPLAYCYDLFAI